MNLSKLSQYFFNNLENSFLNQCPQNIKPKFHKRYLDDTFLLFDTADHTQQFFHYVNNANPNIKFTFEGKTNNALSFLYITVLRINNKFETSVFRKKTFTGLSTNYFSSILYKYKATSIHTFYIGILEFVLRIYHFILKSNFYVIFYAKLLSNL